MKNALLIAALLAASALPAYAQTMSTPAMERSEYGAGNMSHNPSAANTDDQAIRNSVRNSPEGIAEDLRLNGHCDKAVPILRQLADADGDYSVSQFNLGLCLFDLAKAEHDPQHAADMNAEGAEWILRAANAGFGKAQAMAVVLYLDGTGVKADPVEAGKWAYLFHDNGTRLALGISDIAPDVRARLDSVLKGTQRAEAKTRAAGWTQTGEQTDQ